LFILQSTFGIFPGIFVIFWVFFVPLNIFWAFPEFVFALKKSLKKNLILSVWAKPECLTHLAPLGREPSRGPSEPGQQWPWPPWQAAAAILGVRAWATPRHAL
jgi:hypothetical protein